ncbi:MAG: aminotransferase class I/II-fold pyridoxal phosphate-dependent enzyme [Oscillospiraceae bacterium]|nr:aminotransferase class I/II-fold pyridoxal phosphate-dependent enzyme [Ruminococcus sp.]
MNYDNVLSDKIKKIKPSGIRKFFDLASTVDNVISLGVGEPDFQTPWSIRKTAIDTLEKKRIIYSANSGLAALRTEISSYINKKMNVSYDPQNEVIVTVGGSEAIDISLRALINPGDEVLIVEPCFVCYAPIVELSGGIPVSINTRIEDNFKLTPELLKEKITKKTKLLILPFPNNPTGAIMTREDLEKIAEIIRNTNIMILSDEIYSELTYGRKHCSIVQIEGMQERTILINGFSKAFAMTGWRLGYLAAPSPIVNQVLKIHQYAIMCSPTISQYAAIEALQNCDREVKKMVAEYNIRRRLLVESFNKMGLTCFNPEGAFYVFPCIKSTGLTSEQFCEQLLENQKVAVVPGNAFGQSGEGFIRVSYAYSLKHLMEALKRIQAFLDNIKN